MSAEVRTVPRRWLIVPFDTRYAPDTWVGQKKEKEDARRQTEKKENEKGEEGKRAAVSIYEHFRQYWSLTIAQ